MAAWLAIPLFTLGASSGLTVDSLSPDALCPPLEETRKAVAARLGSVELEGTWSATYVLVHRKERDFVVLSLRDPESMLRLERQLPVQGGSCATLSGVIALVLERFFLRPGELPSSSPSPEQEFSPAPASAPAAEPRPSAEAPASSRHSQPPVPEPARVETEAVVPSVPAAGRHFRASAGLWATTSWLAPSLRLERQVSGAYRLGVGAGFDLADHQTEVFEGSLSVRRAPLSVSGEREFSLGRGVNACASLELLGLVERARTKGLGQTGGGTRLVPGLGARVGARFLTDSAAQPFLELTAAWLIGAWAPTFQVGDQEVLPAPALVLGLAWGLGVPF